MPPEVTDTSPWYKQFWPWFIFSIPAISVIAGISLLIIALKNPDYLVVDEKEYQQIKSDLRANPSTQDEPEVDKSPEPNK